MAASQLHFCSTYSSEFCPPLAFKPNRARPSSATRRNNPHPRPDFLLPRPVQTAAPGPRRPPQASMFPPITGVYGPAADVGGAAVGGAQRRPGTCTLPPADHRLKPRPATQGINGDDYIRSAWKNHWSIMPSSLQAFHQRRRPSERGEGHSCFHVVKPFKVGHYIIHPEFMSEMRH